MVGALQPAPQWLCFVATLQNPQRPSTLCFIFCFCQKTSTARDHFLISDRPREVSVLFCGPSPKLHSHTQTALHFRASALTLRPPVREYCLCDPRQTILLALNTQFFFLFVRFPATCFRYPRPCLLLLQLLLRRKLARHVEQSHTPAAFRIALAHSTQRTKPLSDFGLPCS